MENAKKIIECSICGKTFTDPKVLPCQHTFCLKCLETCNNVEQSGCSFCCPLCRNKCAIPKGGLTCLPSNFFIQKLLEIENITADSNKEKLCDGCSGEEGSGKDDSPVPRGLASSVYCFDCQQHFCNQCNKAHSNMRFNKSHKVIKLNDLESDSLMKMTLSFCEKHPDEPVKQYCLDCKVVICLPCYVKEHSTHKCSRIEEEVEQARRKMEEDIVSITEQHSKLLVVAKEIRDEKEMLIDEINSKKDEVIKRLTEVKKLSDKQADDLEKQLDSIKEKKLSELETAEGLNEQHQLMMESFTRYIKEVINQATDAELLRCAKTLATRAADLKAVRTASNFSAVKIEFSTKHAFVGSIKPVKSNSFVLDPLQLHPDKLHSYTRQKISGVEQFQRMTTLGNELYLLSSSNKTSLQQSTLYAILLPSTSNQSSIGYYGLPKQQFISVIVVPVYYETVESSGIKLTFCDLQVDIDKTQAQTSAVTIIISEKDMHFLWDSYSDKDVHTLDMRRPNNKTITIDVKITYKKSSVEIVASSARLSDERIGLLSVDRERIIPAMHSMLQLNVYDSSTYEQHRQMTLYAKTRKRVVVTDMRSCSYYNCIYIGDHANSLIHKFEPLGPSSQIELKEAPIGLSVTKQHTLLVGCSTNKILELSTDGTLLKDISLSILVEPFVLNGTTIRDISWIFPRQIIRLDGDQYLVTGDFPTTGIIPKGTATDRTSFHAYLVDANGVGKPLGSSKVVEVAIDKHGCILILDTNNTIQIRNTEEACEIKEIALSDSSLTGCDQMHFDNEHDRLYLGNSNKPGLTIIKMYSRPSPALSTIAFPMFCEQIRIN